MFCKAYILLRVVLQMLLIPNSPNCVFSFWNGMHYDTQVHIIELCVSSRTVNTFTVFRDTVHGKWADPDAGQSFSFLILVTRSFQSRLLAVALSCSKLVS